MHWLPETQTVQLSKDTILVGEDCWADGRYGNYTDSKVMLNDSRMIQELREGSMIGKYQLLDAMQKLADTDAMKLKQNLQSTIKRYSPKKRACKSFCVTTRLKHEERAAPQTQS